MAKLGHFLLDYACLLPVMRIHGILLFTVFCWARNRTFIRFKIIFDDTKAYENHLAPVPSLTDSHFTTAGGGLFALKFPSQ